MNSRTCASSSLMSSAFSFTRPDALSGATAATGCGGVSSRSAGGASSGEIDAFMTRASLKFLFDGDNHFFEPFVARRIDHVDDHGRGLNAVLRPLFRSLDVTAGAKAVSMRERLQ